jgi:hypothetical protein
MNAILESEEALEPNLKAILPQLALAMDAAGMDPSNEEHQDQFVTLLKKLATNKAALKKAMRTFTASKAMKAVKAAKAAI